jgi:hypothetical protein
LQKAQGLTTTTTATATTEESKDKKKKKKGKLVYKRVDRVYDNKLRDYKEVESSQTKKDEFDSVSSIDASEA